MPWPAGLARTGLSLCGQPLMFLRSFPGFLRVVSARKQATVLGANSKERRLRLGDLRGYFPALLVALLLTALPTAFAQTATTTTLAVTSGGSAATSIASGTVVTLTATVTAGSTPVTPGLVKFCDATATYCEDSHLLGTAQLISAGTATFKFEPANGNHSYKAVFVGTKTYMGGSSSAAALSVTGPTTLTTIVETGSEEEQGGVLGWNLTATVIGSGSMPPSGTISFIDTADGNTALATSALTAQAAGPTWSNTGFFGPTGPSAMAVGDFNGDGIPDVAVLDYPQATVTVVPANGQRKDFWDRSRLRSMEQNPWPWR